MPSRIDTSRISSHQQGTDSDNRAQSAVATVWLAFYALALGGAITFGFGRN